MLRNYLLVGFRALTKNKVYAAINILGLAIGMAACLLILLFVRNEFSYDRDLPNAANTYELQTRYTSRETGQVDAMQMTSYVSGERFKKDFPQVDKLVYALSASPVVLKDGEATPGGPDFLYVSGPFFDVVQLPFLAGDPKTALAQAGTAVLTESEAVKRYGSTNILGKTITLVSKGVSTDYRITGIAKDPPKNSSFRLSIVARVDMQSYWADLPDFLKSWGWQSGWVFLTLKPGTDPATLAAQFPAWEKRNIPDEVVDGVRTNAGDEQDWRLTNIRDIHLGEAQRAAMTAGNDRSSVYTFAVIALLILGMACVNFTNLATARASQRAREVALRKVLGASRRQLIAQFLGESVLVAAVAMLVALAIVELVLPAFSAFLDADLKLRYFGHEGVMLPILALILVVGLAGGIYPALILSGFQPARVLKANKSAADAHGSGLLRTILVVGQFAVSIGLIVCTIVIYAQTIYAQTADPGFRRDGILQIENLSRKQIEPVRQTLIDQINHVDGVTDAALTVIGVETRNTSSRGFKVDGRNQLVGIGTYSIGDGFFDTMGIKLLAGRALDKRLMDDATTPTLENPVANQALANRGLNVVMNELAVKRLGFADPQAAIGKTIKTSMVDSSKYGLTPVTIVGVVQDTRFRSLRTPLEPIMFYHDSYQDYLVVRYHGDPQAVRAKIEAVWRRVARDVPFEAKFSNDIVLKSYRADRARAQIFAAFALLAVIVGCLGLFGLAAFTAERRTKEIGIRKVLGARTRDIIRLLVWQFSRPVLIANLIAWPVAWWAMRGWLNGFDARITLGPAPFVGAGALALVIAVATIGGHAWRVARANPINALRYE